ELAAEIGAGKWVWTCLGAGLGLVWISVVLRREWRRGPDLRGAAIELERYYPELDSRLLAAIEAAERAEPEPGYCERRLIEETLSHSSRNDWRRAVPGWRVAVSQVLNLCSFIVMLGAIWRIWAGANASFSTFVRGMHLEVSPGDTELERGENLVVVVRCTSRVPGQMDLVWGEPGGADRRVAMTRGLADPIFGATIHSIERDLRYRVEFGNSKTREYMVKVYEHPKIEAVEAEVFYPDYTGLPAKRIENARTISAVEGSRLNLRFRLNKPVKWARLVPSGQQREKTIHLSTETGEPVATANTVQLPAAGSYKVELVDNEGRTNKAQHELTFVVVTNRLPELKLVWPRGDLRPSPLEEIKVSAVVSDDFGVVSYGIGYFVAGRDTELVELGCGIPGRQRWSFEQVIALEELGVEPAQLLGWFAWAEDIGPDGQVRRSMTDLFFGEVRPFEEVFREVRNGGDGSDGEQENAGTGESGNDSMRLAELQKQILTATWRLRREAGSVVDQRYRTNVVMLREVQSGVLEQSKTAREAALGSREVSMWQVAITNMESAVRALDRAVSDRGALGAAVDSEQRAYQALLRLNPREYDVAMRQNRRGRANQNNRQESLQRQLDQLDLARPPNQYETESRAQSPLTPERREQLQMLNRLRELAQRQQDLNERFREMQSALQEARTEDSRSQLRRQLKRLEEDQQQMVADIDELRQKLEQLDPGSTLALSEQELDRVRRDLERTVEAVSRGSMPQAVAAGSRAQQQMQELRDRLRRDVAGELGEQLREMRSEARELARGEDEIGRRLDRLAAEASKSLRDPPKPTDLVDLLTRQKERLTNLVEKVARVSEATEQSEPALSRELYDALREFTQEDLEAVKKAQEELIARGLMTRGLYDRLQVLMESGRGKSVDTL
ncbi:MAG: hypothetical protein N3G20_06030, partial [Verrucomicrobiae bacterium]|nr:hypothetical protein [Verrucomicrobiae bacterium]